VDSMIAQGTKIDGVTALAVFLIASFAIDRIVTGFLFLLNFLIPRWNAWFPDPASIRDAVAREFVEKRQKILYFSLAGCLGLLLSWYGNLRLLRSVGFQTQPVIDSIVTMLILMGGSDRIAEVLKLPGAPGVKKTEPKPIEITGKLILENEAGRKASMPSEDSPPLEKT